MNSVELGKEGYMLRVEAKRSPRAAIGQCLLSMKATENKNHESVVYGFITTGESWRVLGYHDKSFQVTDRIEVLFGVLSHREKKKCSHIA